MITSNSEGNKLPLVILRISGIDRRFLIDTGAGMTIIKPSIVPVLNTDQMARTFKSVGYGIGGKESTIDVPVRFNFVGVIIHTVVVSENIFDSVAKSGLFIDGIIGNDILRCFASIEFDFKNEVIRFTS